MAKTLLTLRTQLRKELRDPDAIRFPDSDLNYSLNQAYRRLYLSVIKANQGYFEKAVYHNIVKGTATIALPADHFTTVSLEYATSNVETPIFKRNRGVAPNIISGSGTTFGTQNFTYNFVGPNIVLEPTPQVSVANGIKHKYISILVEANDLSLAGDTVHADFKDIWCDGIVLGSAMGCLSQIEVLGAYVSQDIIERYNETMALIKDTLGLRSLSPNKNRRSKGYFS